MPDLNTPIHLDMLSTSPTRTSLPVRLWSAIKKELFSRDIYGMEWGDPQVVPPLQYIKQTCLDPYVRSHQTALEIGPGGGRWTRYLLPFKKLYVVDYHAELLAELKKTFKTPNMVFVKNSGTDFPGVESASVDFVFSFGVFVHLDPPLIESYLNNLKPLLRPHANVVLQYADKTKVMAQINDGFSDMTPDKMRNMVKNGGYRIVKEDLTTLWHSSMIVFGLA